MWKYLDPEYVKSSQNSVKESTQLNPIKNQQKIWTETDSKRFEQIWTDSFSKEYIWIAK